MDSWITAGLFRTSNPHQFFLQTPCLRTTRLVPRSDAASCVEALQAEASKTISDCSTPRTARSYIIAHLERDRQDVQLHLTPSWRSRYFLPQFASYVPNRLPSGSLKFAYHPCSLSAVFFKTLTPPSFSILFSIYICQPSTHDKRIPM